MSEIISSYLSTCHVLQYNCNAYYIAISPNGKFGCYSSFDEDEEQGYLTIFEIKNGNILYKFKAHSHTANSISYSSDGFKIITCENMHNQIIIWDSQTGQEIKRLKSLSGGKFVKFIENDTKVISCDTNGIYIWDYNTGELLKAIKYNKFIFMVYPNVENVQSIQDKFVLVNDNDSSFLQLIQADISTDSKKIICNFGDRVVVYGLYDNSYQEIQFESESEKVSYVNFLSNETIIIANSKIQIFNLTDQSLINFNLDGFNDFKKAVISENKEKIAFIYQTSICIYDLINFRLINKLEFGELIRTVRLIIFTPNRDQLIINTPHINLWDFNENILFSTGH